jgi:hypothetical protein
VHSIIKSKMHGMALCCNLVPWGIIFPSICMVIEFGLLVWLHNFHMCEVFFPMLIYIKYFAWHHGFYEFVLIVVEYCWDKCYDFVCDTLNVIFHNP